VAHIGRLRESSGKTAVFFKTVRRQLRAMPLGTHLGAFSRNVTSGIALLPRHTPTVESEDAKGGVPRSQRVEEATARVLFPLARPRNNTFASARRGCRVIRRSQELCVAQSLQLRVRRCRRARRGGRKSRLPYSRPAQNETTRTKTRRPPTRKPRRSRRPTIREHHYAEARKADPQGARL